MSASEPNSPSVLIVYAHHPDGRPARVLDLAQRLWADGIDVRLDQFEPTPAEGWPQWTETQLDGADWIVVACTEAWVSRFHGQLDAHGGRGVAWESLLIREEIYRNGPERFVIVRWADDEVPGRIPRPLFERPVFELDGDYRQLVEHLGPTTGASIEVPVKRAPPLPSPRSAYAVVVDDTPRQPELGERVAASLRVPVVGSRDLKQIQLALVVVFLGEHLNEPMRRIAAAPDRDLIALHGTNAPDASIKVEEDLPALVSAARRCYRRRQRAWWRAGGLRLALGLLLVSIGLSICAVFWHRADISPHLWAALWTIGSGSLLLAGVVRWVDTHSFALRRRPDRVGPLLEWVGLTVRYALFDAARGERRAHWTLTIIAFVLVWLTAYRSALGSTAWQYGPYLVSGVVALGLGVVSVSLAATRVRLWWVASALLCVVAGRVLPNLAVGWVDYGPEGGEALSSLLHAPAGYSKTAWLLIGPAIAPLLVAAATFAAMLFARVTGTWTVRRLDVFGVLMLIAATIGLVIRGQPLAS